MFWTWSAAAAVVISAGTALNSPKEFKQTLQPHLRLWPSRQKCKNVINTRIFGFITKFFNKYLASNLQKRETCLIQCLIISRGRRSSCFTSSVTINCNFDHVWLLSDVRQWNWAAVCWLYTLKNCSFCFHFSFLSAGAENLSSLECARRQSAAPFWQEVAQPQVL